MSSLQGNAFSALWETTRLRRHAFSGNTDRGRRQGGAGTACKEFDERLKITGTVKWTLSCAGGDLTATRLQLARLEGEGSEVQMGDWWASAGR